MIHVGGPRSPQQTGEVMLKTNPLQDCLYTGQKRLRSNIKIVHVDM